jgi:hypothetical protein
MYCVVKTFKRWIGITAKLLKKVKSIEGRILHIGLLTTDMMGNLWYILYFSE